MKVPNPQPCRVLTVAALAALSGVGSRVERADVPISLDRDAARGVARAELAKPEYQGARPGLVERIVEWLQDRWQALRYTAGVISPGGVAGFVLVTVLLVVALLLLRRYLGPTRRAEADRQRALFGEATRSAAQHRAAAEAHAAAGEWALAVRERLRAIVRNLEERELLDPRPGRTADEAAAEAGAALPERAGELREAAATFDDIWYGGRPATAEADRALRRIDEQVRSTRPLLIDELRAGNFRAGAPR